MFHEEDFRSGIFGGCLEGPTLVLDCLQAQLLGASVIASLLRQQPSQIAKRAAQQMLRLDMPWVAIGQAL